MLSEHCIDQNSCWLYLINSFYLVHPFLFTLTSEWPGIALWNIVAYHGFLHHCSDKTVRDTHFEFLQDSLWQIPGHWHLVSAFYSLTQWFPLRWMTRKVSIHLVLYISQSRFKFISILMPFLNCPNFIGIILSMICDNYHTCVYWWLQLICCSCKKLHCFRK